MVMENRPSSNSPQLNPSETGVNIGMPGNLEGGLDIKGVEKLGETGQEVGSTQLSSENQLEILERVITGKQQEVTTLTQSAEGDKAELDKERGKLELPPLEGETPNALLNKEQLRSLQEKQETLESQKRELVNQIEKERLIREEKVKILQERLDELFKEFGSLSPRDLKSVLKNGRTREGTNVESRSMGELGPEMVKILAKFFTEGAKSLSEISEILPDLSKKLDEELTKEATERVEKKIEEEKKKKGESEQGKEGKPEEPKSEGIQEIPGSEIPMPKPNPEGVPIEGGDIKTPEV